MGEHEIEAVRRMVVFLLALGALRLAWAVTPSAPPLLAGAPAVGDSLLDATTAALDERTRRTRPLEAGERIDLNRAGEEELDRLPRVGPALARAIVAERERGGPFRGIEDLTRVRGIGPATAERLGPLLEIRGGPVPPAGSPATPSPEPVLSLGAATPADLERLPGVGPALAARIVEVRARRGGFRRVEDLLEVPGIGPVTLERLRGRVRVP